MIRYLMGLKHKLKQKQFEHEVAERILDTAGSQENFI